MLKASALTGCCRARQVQLICCVTGGISTSCHSLETAPAPLAALGTSLNTCPWPGDTDPARGVGAPVMPGQEELGSGSPRCWMGSWAVPSPLQSPCSQGGRWAGASAIYEVICTAGPVVLPQPVHPGGLHSPQEGVGCGTRRSLHSAALPLTLFPTFCSCCCPNQRGTAKLGPRGGPVGSG